MNRTEDREEFAALRDGIAAGAMDRGAEGRGNAGFTGIPGAGTAFALMAVELPPKRDPCTAGGQERQE